MVHDRANVLVRTTHLNCIRTGLLLLTKPDKNVSFNSLKVIYNVIIPDVYIDMFSRSLPENVYLVT